MGITRTERELRRISDEHLDDTAVEMQLMDDMELFIRGIKQALLDRLITVQEAQEILESAVHLYILTTESYRRNVAVERMLTEFGKKLRQEACGAT